MTADKIIQCHQRIFVTTAKAITIEDYFVAARAQDNRDNAPSRLVLPTNMPHQIVPLCRFHEGVRGGGSRLRRDLSPPILLQKFESVCFDTETKPALYNKHAHPVHSGLGAKI